MRSDLAEVIAQRDRYRTLLYERIKNDELARTIAKFGGRPKVLTVILEPQLAVRETVDDTFELIVIDPATGLERPGVDLLDLLTDLRSSTDYAGAFESKPKDAVKLANNPWARGNENITQQALLTRRNPGMAARMKAEALSDAEARL